MAQQDSGWQLWAALIATTRREVVNPSWAAVAPQLAPNRPHGAPLLAGATLTLAPRLAHRWIEQLFRRAAPALYPPGARPGASTLQHADALPFLEAAILPGDGHLDELAAVLGMETPSLASIAHLAALPPLHACARALEQRIPPVWPYHYCPVCGAWPTSAERRGVERTYGFRCSRCGGDWGMSLLCCPYCGENDHRRLGVLVPAHGGETRQVSVCKTCNGYLKVLTTLQSTPSEQLISDDLESVDLDIVALERGYLRPKQPGHTFKIHILPRVSRVRAWFGGREVSQQDAKGYEDATPC